MVLLLYVYSQVSILKDMYHFVMPEHRELGKRSISGLPVYHLTEALEKEPNVSSGQHHAVFTLACGLVS